jgi:hypothetical protein
VVLVALENHEFRIAFILERLLEGMDVQGDEARRKCSLPIPG